MSKITINLSNKDIKKVRHSKAVVRNKVFKLVLKECEILYLDTDSVTYSENGTVKTEKFNLDENDKIK